MGKLYETPKFCSSLKSQVEADVETVDGRQLLFLRNNGRVTTTFHRLIPLQKMAETLEETSFDYIVLGTGFVESILAG